MRLSIAFNIFILLIMGVLPSVAAASDSASVTNKIAIFYPDAKNPYRSIYQEIISGSKSHSHLEFHEFLIKRDFDSNQIIEELRKLGIKKVIVLGRLGFRLAKKLPEEFSVVSGALPISPNGVSGISLISDPANLFDYLKLVAPEVRRVHVAFSKRSEWLINKAKTAASARDLELVSIKVSETAEAVKFYENLFESDISSQDAIWLPVDKISSHDKVTLPFILEKAWSKEVVVFSSKPSHAKRGALFSTYPDNFGLGKQLSSMVQELAEKPTEKKFAALTSLQLAVNLRTAAHLGFKYSSEQQQNFKMTFPE
ncbi:ABC transporter substrate binding protein [Aliikangiella coralliicola]|uniref:ABC transporter substrate-binding protein n=1 Tax=Aliikangiella coralliicola TaxID=2592383 RepID=A0A545U520_9GAMM|nr:ABC transporter substrate binding protein [Aliikangiella coralliicola]TQV84567.1 hypothetical protein FLL46_23435 [Aliikangiella coralliicola]